MHEMHVDWSGSAQAWDLHRADVEAMKADLTRLLLEALAPLAGRRVLELGAGTGELAARLAEAVGPSGSVLASDIAPGMVALLEKRLADVDNAEVATLDAADIDLPAQSVDAAVFRMGLMLLTDPDAGLAQLRRVVRPGGRIAVAVWGGPFENPWMTTVGMAAMMHGLVQGGPPVGPGGPFSLADPDDLEKRARGAGFTDVTVTRVASTRRFRDSDEHVDTVLALSPPLNAALASATPEQVAAVRAQVGALTEQFRTADGLHIPTTSLLCVAS
jgi:SAM-dependent methyltransferase